MYRRKPLIGISILILIALILPLHHYGQNVYPLRIAFGYLDRAVASGFADEMIKYAKKALERLEPYSVNPVWIFPSPSTEFNLIKENLRECIERLEVLKGLPRESDAYQQGLDDVRGKLKVIQGNIEDCSWWVFISLPNFIYGILWLTALIVTAFIWMKRK